MRVLHLDSGREMRGGQWQVLRLHRGLIAAGHESYLLARTGSPLLEIATREGLPCGALRLLSLGMFSRRFDIVHAHDARSHALGALSAKVRLVVSRRVAFPVGDSGASRWKYRQPALFLAVSCHVAERLRSAGIEDSRIAVVYDGVPIPPEPANGDAVLIPHTLDPEKGMALAMEAADVAGVAAHVSQNLSADLPHARAMIYLTRSEGLGSGILMAMSWGVSVIASNIGGIPELIRDGENGILVPNEAKAVARALGSIDPALGQAARATVAERFTEQRMIEATLAAYARVTHG
jgi:hypothetical protein